MTMSSSHMTGAMSQARSATLMYPYRTPAEATSSQQKTQRRGGPKYLYFSRSSGGLGR